MIIDLILFLVLNASHGLPTTLLFEISYPSSLL